MEPAFETVIAKRSSGVRAEWLYRDYRPPSYLFVVLRCNTLLTRNKKEVWAAMSGSMEYEQLLARERINLRHPEELELWTAILDVYVADIVMAVAEVGDSSRKVLAYLQAHDIPGKMSRTPAATPKPDGRPTE
jgi:hypothetical protein